VRCTIENLFKPSIFLPEQKTPRSELETNSVSSGVSGWTPINNIYQLGITGKRIQDGVSKGITG
jgi:hypothetical protein